MKNILIFSSSFLILFEISEAWFLPRIPKYNPRRPYIRCVANNSVDIAIIGAGPSGTYAAYKLRNSNKKINLYELSDRIGGRTFTYSLPDAPDINAELGGMRYVGGLQFRLDNLVDELGLTRTPFVEQFGIDGRTWWYLLNKWISQEDLRTEEIPYNLTPEEKVNQNRLLPYYFEQLTGLTGPVVPDKAHTIKLKPEFGGRPLYQLTLLEALEKVASPGGIQFARDRLNFHSEFDDKVSAIVAFSSVLPFINRQITGIFTVAEGYSTVAETMAMKFNESNENNKIYLNKQLRFITKRKEFMVLGFNDRKSRNQSYTCAKQVILAMSKTALSDLSYRPIQSSEYKFALKGLKTSDTMKVFMTFDFPWWLNATNRNTTNAYVTRTDLTYSQSYDFKVSQTTGKAVLMASYADGVDSENLRNYQKQGDSIPGTADGRLRVSTALRDEILKELAQAYNIPVSSIPPVRSSVAKFWINKPSGGGWTLWQAGFHQVDILNRLRRPSLMDEVYVVGSDFNYAFTVPWVESGLEVVDQVLETYNFV